jgi:hypothetical protein
MPTPTTLIMNWTGVTFTPAGGSAIPLKRVNSVNFDPGGQLLPYSGDGDRYPTAMVLAMSSPTASLSTSNISQISALAIGTVGTLVAIANDAVNGILTGGGAITYTLINAVVAGTPWGGQHAQFGTANLTFQAYSSDGSTTPLSQAAL